MPDTTHSKRKHQPADLEKELLVWAREGDLDRIRDLVEIQRVSVNPTEKQDVTPLIQAVLWEHAEVARYLLENGADVDAADYSDDTALACAIYNNDVAVAELLLEHGPNVEKDCRGNSPLALALRRGSAGVVTLLLRFGANAEKTLSNGRTYSALYIACHSDANGRRNIEIVRSLLDHDDGAHVNTFFQALCRRGNKIDLVAVSPLCLACQYGDTEIARHLIQNEAQVIFPGVYPTTPCPLLDAVDNAIDSENLDLIRLLLDNSPFSLSNKKRNPVFETDDIHPLTVPLQYALERNGLVEAQLLLDHGANVNAEPFLCECAQQDPKNGRSASPCVQARLLLQAGANVNQRNKTGQTPLWIAASKGKVGLVKLLLEAKANVNICDNDGRETPLGVAYRKGHRGVVYLLLRTSPHVWSRLKDVW